MLPFLVTCYCQSYTQDATRFACVCSVRAVCGIMELIHTIITTAKCQYKATQNNAQLRQSLDPSSRLRIYASVQNIKLVYETY